MKKNIGIACSIVAVIVFVVVAIVILRSNDKKGPTIKFSNSTVMYNEDMSIEVLMNGVKAIDSKDGDVSDAVMVESIVVLEDGKSARVVYVAKDKDNNITRADRMVSYNGKLTGSILRGSVEIEGLDATSRPTVTNAETTAEATTETESESTTATEETTTTAANRGNNSGQSSRPTAQQSGGNQQQQEQEDNSDSQEEPDEEEQGGASEPEQGGESEQEPETPAESEPDTEATERPSSTEQDTEESDDESSDEGEESE